MRAVPPVVSAARHVTSEAIAACYDAGVLTVRVTGALKDPAGNQAQRITISK
jgi:HSP20 family protein